MNWRERKFLGFLSSKFEMIIIIITIINISIINISIIIIIDNLASLSSISYHHVLPLHKSQWGVVNFKFLNFFWRSTDN